MQRHRNSSGRRAVRIVADTALTALTASVATLVCMASVTSMAGAQLPPIAAKELPAPARTTWAPSGCRTVPITHPVRLTGGWHNVHANAVNSDELPVVLTPVFRAGWLAESEHYFPTGPVMDSAGNLYAAPMMPHEPIVMVSLDATTGTRRWAIENTTGAPPGGAAPMVLRDPDNPGDEIIYLTLYDRVIAVRPDGSMVWDVPTGMTHQGQFENVVFGNNYHAAADAIVGVSTDGYVFAVDRKTGATLLDTPYELPGSRSPPSSRYVSPRGVALGNLIVGAFIALPPGSNWTDYRDILLANNVEVANQIAIAPDTSRIFIAATAPDDADGTVDGVSALGALYGFDLVADEQGYELVEACMTVFEGSSASTPSMRTDGSRLYVGDHYGKLIAINPDCSEAWTLDLGSPTTGSVGVSSDNGELYVAGSQGVFKVIDEGTQGRLEWMASLDVFDIPQELLDQGYAAFNMNLVSIGANALYVQVGVGPNNLMPFSMGMGQIDRATGVIRSFAEGIDEVGVMSTGADGSLYGGHSPIRRISSYVSARLAPNTYPWTPAITGGIRKWPAKRYDLLARDGACAAADRLGNAIANLSTCSESAGTDVLQVQRLIAQSRDAAERAVQRRDMLEQDWAALDWELSRADSHLGQDLPTAFEALNAACNLFE